MGRVDLSVADAAYPRLMVFKIYKSIQATTRGEVMTKRGLHIWVLEKWQKERWEIRQSNVVRARVREWAVVWRKHIPGVRVRVRKYVPEVK